jgi:hypothetical protein
VANADIIRVLGATHVGTEPPQCSQEDDGQR